MTIRSSAGLTGMQRVGRLAAHQEHTVMIRRGAALVLTAATAA